MRRLGPAVTFLGVLAWGACAGPDPDVDDSAPESDAPDDTDQADDTDVAPPDSDPPGAVMTIEGPVTVDSAGIRACANPSRRAQSPWDVRYATPQALTNALGEHSVTGGGVVVADLTGDGRLDTFLPGLREVQLHVQSANVSFNDEWFTRLGGLDLSDATGASVVDVDADGDLDLYVTRFLQPNRLLINDGTGYFTDGTAAAGLLTEGRRSEASAWGDMDRDGDLDLVVGNYGPKPEEGLAVLGDEFIAGDPSWLFRNDGDGTFTDVSDILPPLLQRAHTFMVGWHDLDRDGYPELLFINDFGWNRPNVLFWNRPEGLVPDDGRAGFSLAFAGMGLAMGDLNDDEVPDFLQTSWKAISLLVSNSGLWFESADLAGILPRIDPPPSQIFGWGTDMADLDLDGDLDAVVGYGWWDEYGPDRTQYDAFFLQKAPMAFEDASRSWGLADPEVTRGVVIADINSDGWPDVMKRCLGTHTPMYLSRCGREAWLELSLRAPGPNTRAIGARVRVTDHGARWNRWVLSGGTSMYAAYEPEVHFGLGMREVVEQVEIFWPDGTVATLRDVPTRQKLTVTLQP
ncbi:MAG TPA: CRTAC1 family protein [Myxococcota bacterium]|nr:CRTAC1 family protein [Myxococcota bacterium]